MRVFAGGVLGLALMLTVTLTVTTVQAWAASIPRSWVAEQQDAAPSATQAQLDQLASILSRPEFRAAEGRGWLDGLLAPLRDWGRWLLLQMLRLFAQGLRAGGAGLEIGVVLVGLAVVMVAAIGVRRMLRGALVGDAGIDGGRAGAPLRALDELAQARVLAASGDARGAVHHQYLAVLLRLDERDHLPFDGTLTNRELVPRIGTSPELAAIFGDLVSMFDRLWYGQATCTLEEYAAFARLAERVWTAAEAVVPSLPDAAVPATPLALRR